MPRPKPSPESAPHKTTISVPKYVYETSRLIGIAASPPEDFSTVVAKALVEYAANHGHIDLLTEMREALAVGQNPPLVATTFPPTPRPRPESKVATRPQDGKEKSA